MESSAVPPHIRILDGRDLPRLQQRIRADAFCTVLVADSESDPACIDALAGEVVDRIIPSYAPAGIWRRELAAIAERVSSLRALAMGRRAYAPGHVLVTGATGFFGRVFLKLLLLNTPTRLSLVVRNLPNAPAQQRLPALQRSFPGRIRMLSGDIRQPDLGLTAPDMEALADVDEVWHLAASTNFEHTLREKTFATNIDGTRNALALTRTLPDVRSFNHVSTAYVAGVPLKRSPIVESHVGRPRQFRNPYEESKFEAERLVASSGLPHRIFRPSILMGDSISGRGDGQTIYNIAKLVRMARRLAERDCERRNLPDDHHSFRIVANTKAEKNLIPADHAAALMLRMASENSADGSIFHITHDRPVSIGTMVDVIAGLLGATGYEIVPTLDGQTLSLPERAMDKVAQVFGPYMTESDPVFDTARLRTVLGELKLPAVDEKYLEWTIATFYRLTQPRRAS